MTPRELILESSPTFEKGIELLPDGKFRLFVRVKGEKKAVQSITLKGEGFRKAMEEIGGSL